MGFWGYCCEWEFEHPLILSSFSPCHLWKQELCSPSGGCLVVAMLLWVSQAAWAALPLFIQGTASTKISTKQKSSWSSHVFSSRKRACLGVAGVGVRCVLRTSGLLGKFDIFKNRFIFCRNYWYLERQLVRRKKILHIFLLAESCQLWGKLNLLELLHSLFSL